MKEINELLERLWIPPQGDSWRGLATYPVYRRAHWQPDPERACHYVTLSEALASGQATVSELPSAHVPELLVTNQGPSLVLGLDGDELLGGKQNRVLNSTVLLGQGETRVPVSCVEQRRWRVTGRTDFRGGERLPHGLRAISHGHVAHSLRSHGGHASDQRAIWDQIAHGHQRAHTTSSTGALHDWYQAQDEVLRAYQEALPYPAHALGLVVGIGGRLAACDVFDQAKTAEIYWPRLIRACAAEALHGEQHRLPAEAPQTLLQGLVGCELKTFPSPSLGTDVRLDGQGLFGSALIHQSIVVHLSLFSHAIPSKTEV